MGIHVYVHNLYGLKLSLVTVVYNAQDTIGQCIESVIGQNYPDLEYIVIDGCSTDNTLSVINQYRPYISILISEPDNGIYDAMNKGISRATGEVVGILNADDFFAGHDILQSVATVFEQQNTDALYGNLDIINKQGKIVRKWRSHQHGANSFNLGFMPPHPTFYCRRSLFEKLGPYKMDYGSAADYELLVRFVHFCKIRTFYLNKVMVKMRIGGVSSKSLTGRFTAWKFDLKAMRQNNIKLPLLAVVLKPLQKIIQFI